MLVENLLSHQVRVLSIISLSDLQGALAISDSATTALPPGGTEFEFMEYLMAKEKAK